MRRWHQFTSWLSRRPGGAAAAPAIDVGAVVDDASARLLREARQRRDPAWFARTLWDEQWASPTWIVLVGPLRPRLRGLPPLIAPRLAGMPMICLFSSVERIAPTLEHWPLEPLPEGANGLALERDVACDWICAQHLAECALLDPADPRFPAAMPVWELAADYERRLDRLTPRMAGRFAEAANRGGPQTRARFVRRLLHGPEWWFIGTEKKPNAPAIVPAPGGKFAIALFTDAERARRGAASVTGQLDEGHGIPFPTTPRTGVSYLRRVHERVRNDLLAIIVNGVPEEAGEPAAIPITEVLAAAEAEGA